MMDFVTGRSTCISWKIIDFHLHFSFRKIFFGKMGYKLGINDFHFHVHVVHTYYDYLKELLSSFSSSSVPCFICYQINANIPHNLLNCKPLIINIINTQIEVTQKNVCLIRGNFNSKWAF